MLLFSFLIGFHIMCSVLAFGLTFAYFQRRWPTIAEEQYTKDRAFAFFLSLYGPIALIVVLYRGRLKYGIKFK